MIDTHSHLYDGAFDADRNEAVTRAVGAGVERIMLPAIDSGSHEMLFEMCRRYPGICYPMMGLHPTHVNDNPEYEKELQLVEKYLREPPAGIDRFYAVGEVGLDLYWNKDFLHRQISVFERQIELSIKSGLPLVIHTRAAWGEMTQTLQRYRDRGIRGIMHSFSGSYSDYLHVKECGDFMFGIGGVATYKNSGLPELLRKMSPDDIVLETDCPYLTPVPFRGKRNESAYLKYIRNTVAEILSLSPEETDRTTTRNAAKMFGIADEGGETCVI